MVLMLPCGWALSFTPLYNFSVTSQLCLGVRKLCAHFHSAASVKCYEPENQEKNNWGITRQNQQNDLCAQPRLRAAWASGQSNQSLRSPPEEALSSVRPTKTQSRLGIRPV